MFGAKNNLQSGSSVIQGKHIKKYSFNFSEPEKVKKKIKYYQKN